MIKTEEALADFVYDPEHWEYTADWQDRALLTDDLIGELWEPKEFATLAKGPPVWAKEVVLSRDEYGDPDETEIQWFDSLEAAERAGVPETEEAAE